MALPHISDQNISAALDHALHFTYSYGICGPAVRINIGDICRAVSGQKHRMIRCIALPYTPSAEKTAQAIETYANQKEKEGWELITCSITPSARAILIFRTQ